MNQDNLTSQRPAQSTQSTRAAQSLSPSPARRNRASRRRQPPAPTVTSHYANMSNFTIHGGNFTTVGGEVIHDFHAEEPRRSPSPDSDVPSSGDEESASRPPPPYGGIRISTFEGARNGTFSGGRFLSVAGNVVPGPQRISSPEPVRGRAPDAEDDDFPRIPANFFQGATNVTINSATFSEVNGNLTVYCNRPYSSLQHSRPRYDGHGNYSAYSTGESHYRQYAGHAEPDVPKIIVVPPGDIPIYDSYGCLAGYRTPSEAERTSAAEQEAADNELAGQSSNTDNQQSARPPSPAAAAASNPPSHRHAADTRTAGDAYYQSVRDAHIRLAHEESTRARSQRRGFGRATRAQSPQHWDELMGRGTLYGALRAVGDVLGRRSAPPRDDVTLGRDNVPGHRGRQSRRTRPLVL